MSRSTQRFLFAFVVGTNLLTGGCEKSKVTADNFAKVKVGMLLSEVTSILGSKYEDQTASAGYNANATGLSATASPENVYIFTSKDVKIVVIVKNGRVVQATKPEG